MILFDVKLLLEMAPMAMVMIVHQVIMRHGMVVMELLDLEEQLVELVNRPVAFSQILVALVALVALVEPVEQMLLRLGVVRQTEQLVVQVPMGEMKIAVLLDFLEQLALEQLAVLQE